MLTSAKAFMPKRSKLPGKFRRRAGKTMPSWRCSETSTRVSVTRPGLKRFSGRRSNEILITTSTIFRSPSFNSGKIMWGLGIVSVLEGKTPQAAENLERAVDLLPEWPGSYSTLGVFYYQTGEITKAREVLNRFKGSNAAGGLDVNRIEEALAKARVTSSSLREPMPMVARQQLLQLALSLADRTL